MTDLWAPLPTSALGLATTAHAVLGVLRKHRSQSGSFPWMVVPAAAFAAAPWLFPYAAGVGAGLLLHLLWFAVCEMFVSRDRSAARDDPRRNTGGSTGFLPLPVLSVTDVSPTIRTFRMARPASFSFQAGQFLTVRAHVDGKAHVRCYSISSAPESAEYIEISVKRQGLVSGALHASVRPGSHVFVRPPAGRFTYPIDDDGPIVLVAGGVGITPMISMAKHAVATEPGRPVTLLYSTRGEQELAFWNELCDLAATHAQLVVVATLTAAGPTWTGRVGRIGERVITECVADPSRAVFLICGPSEMIAEVRRTLERLGVPADRVRFEVFQPAAAIRASPRTGGAAVPEDAAKTRQVTFAKSQRSVTVEPVQSLLDAADEARVDIPSLCRAGVCGTCRTRVVSGDVDCTSDALGTADRADGWTLPCVAFAHTDCSLDA